MTATRKAMSKDGMSAYTNGLFDYQIGAFNEQFDNFEQLLGASTVPGATEHLKHLNEAISGIIQ